VLSKLKLAALVATSVLPNRLKLAVYRRVFGARIGSDVRVGFGAVLCSDELALDSGSRIGSLNIIRAHSFHLGKRGRIGSFTRIVCHTVDLGPASTIGSQVSIVADQNDPRSKLAMGAESWIFDYCYVNPTRPISLGRNVGVGGGSYLFTHGYWLSRLDGYPVSYAPVEIGDDVWLPWGCFIMPGVSIGSGAVVGARSLVTKPLPAGVLAAGSPAKVLREQVASPLSLDEKNRVLLEATREFAEITGRSVHVTEFRDWIDCRVDDIPLFKLASGEQVNSYPPPEATELCLVHHAYSMGDGAHPRMMSLTSYQCCPYSDIAPLQKDWLKHMRNIGLRFYPIDETSVEP
jgi:acetyltransferase-like isoleucine patch superfamily enzyme